MNRIDALRILNVSELASETEIKTAYRKLALAFHPDHNPSPESRDRFIEIHEAYEFLTRKNQSYKSQESEYQTNTKKDKRYGSSSFYDSNFGSIDPEKRYQWARQAYEEAFEKRSQRIYQRFFDDYKTGYKRKLVILITVFSTLLALVFTFDFLSPSLEDTKVASLIQKEDYSAFFLVIEGREVKISREFYFSNKGHLLVAEYELSPYFQDFKSIEILRVTDGKFWDLTPTTPASSFPLVPLILVFPLLSFLKEVPSFNFVFFVIHFNLILIPLIIFLLLTWGGRFGRLSIYLESVI
ncbi:MAG: J domain-containing protein [Bacteroidales bacterium]|nr:J domain-containing protein [Bacteroidales bacterium]